MKPVVASLSVLVLMCSGRALQAELLVEVPSGPHHVGLGGGLYAEGATARVQAAPAVGYRFVRWEGDVPAGRETENPLTFVPVGPTRLQAVVEPAEDPWAGWVQTRIFRWQRTGQPTTVFAGKNRVRQVGVGRYGLGLLLDGSVVRLFGTQPNFEGYFQLGGRVVELALGLNETLAKLDDGRVADLTETTRLVPTLPGGLEHVRQMAMNPFGSGGLFVLEDGRLTSTLTNRLPTLVQRFFPTDLPRVRAASLGWKHALVVGEDGRVIAWGSNDAGQLEVPPNLPAAVSVVAGLSNSFAIHPDGTVTGWGLIPTNWNLSALSDVVDLKVLSWGLAALRRDGTVWNEAGEPLPDLERVVQITALGPPAETFFALAVERVGVVERLPARQVVRAGEPLTVQAPIWGATGVQWYKNGEPLAGQTQLALQLAATTRTDSGLYQVAAWDAQEAVSESVQVCVVEAQVTGAGQVQARWLEETAEVELRAVPEAGWKWRQWNLAPDRPVARLDAATALEGVLVTVEFVPAESRTVRVSSLGQGWVAGGGTYDEGRLVRLTAAPAVGWRFVRWSEGVPVDQQHENPVELELQGDLDVEAEFGPAENPRQGWFEGRVFAWRKHWQFYEVDTGPFAAIRGNDSDRGALLLRSDGTVAELRTFGNSPVTVAGLSNVVAITRGGTPGWSYVVLENGVVLDLPGTDPSVPHGLRAVEVGAGVGYGLALKADGTLAYWPMGDRLAMKPPPEGLDEVWHIATGWSHALALRADGHLVYWGVSLPIGPYPPPEDWSNVVSVATLVEHDLVLLEDGSVRAWGSNEAGETMIVPGYTNAAAVYAGTFASMIINRQGLPLIWGSLEYGSWPPPAGLRDVVEFAEVKYGYILALVGPEVGLAQPVPTHYSLRPGQRLVLEPRFHAARSYAWYKDGQLLPGHTRSHLKLGPVTPADAGVYQVVAFGRDRALSYRMEVEIAAPSPRLALGLNRASAQAQFQWTPPLPAPATLESSTNLQQWEPAAELPAGTDRLDLPWAAGEPARFYRLRLAP